MNLTYYKFLFCTTVKRKSIWITWLLYLLVTACFLIIVPIATGLNALQLWTNSSMLICQTFMGVMVSVFTAVLAINIFKTSNEEGTELIIISKPIARRKVVWSKFVVFFTYCLFANLTAVLLSVFTIFLPTTEKAFYWGLILSMFIGNLVSFGIFGAIAILLSVRLAKVGVIVCNVVISIVIFCYQIMAVFVFSSTMTNLVGLDKNNTVTYQSYILPVRNTKDGTYTEKNFVGFLSNLKSDSTYDMHVTNWEGVRDYWDAKNAKNNPALIIGTDIGSQLASTYLTANVHKYADRFASRMYNMSNYYSYKLTGPVSQEFYENNSPFRMVYSGVKYWMKLGNKNIYLPSNYVFQALRSTKAPFLKGNITSSIPVADIKGSNLLDTTDVYFEPTDWVKYKPAFDIMYDNIFKYNIKNGSGNYYYTFDLNTVSNNFQLNQVWMNSDSRNITKYYNLVWACFTGHHSDNEYFGSENDPLAGYTKEFFDISTPLDINKRFIQFKTYCFYKVYEDQRNLMINGLSTESEQFEVEKTLYNNLKTSFETIIGEYGLTQYGDEQYPLADYSFVLRAPKSKTPEEDKICLEPGTQTINYPLLESLKDAVKSSFQAKGVSPTDEAWLKEAEYGSYAKWIKTSSVIQNCVNIDEYYMYDSLDLPERNDTYSCEMYITKKTWYPYYVNLVARDAGTYLPYGQNLELIFFESNSRVQYWYFTVIWGSIALATLAGGVLVYNKFDVK